MRKTLIVCAAPFISCNISVINLCLVFSLMFLLLSFVSVIPIRCLVIFLRSLFPLFLFIVICFPSFLVSFLTRSCYLSSVSSFYLLLLVFFFIEFPLYFVIYLHFHVYWCSYSFPSSLLFFVSFAFALLLVVVLFVAFILLHLLFHFSLLFPLFHFSCFFVFFVPFPPLNDRSLLLFISFPFFLVSFIPFGVLIFPSFPRFLFIFTHLLFPFRFFFTFLLPLYFNIQFPYSF